VQSKSILSALLLFPLVAGSAQQKPAAADSSYSSRHSAIIPESEKYTRRIASPDGLKFVTATLLDDPDEGYIQRIQVTVSSQKFTLKTKGRGAEILWSPDSRWLAVTYTWCCSGFSPFLHIYEVSKSGVRDLNVKDPLTIGFGRYIRCEKGTTARQWASTAAVKWLDSSHLLTAVQVPHVSVCDSMGVFELREMSLPDLLIVRTYGQLEAKRLFAEDLGGNLREANDQCVRDPKSCWIAFHHPLANDNE
jgi:hypothetical protein